MIEPSRKRNERLPSLRSKRMLPNRRSSKKPMLLINNSKPLPWTQLRVQPMHFLLVGWHFKIQLVVTTTTPIK